MKGMLLPQLLCYAMPGRPEIDLENNNNRAFADFIFGSMILHFFCVNFIN